MGNQRRSSDRTNPGYGEMGDRGTDQVATLNHERRRNAIIAFLSVAVIVPFVWMIMDRDPPYVRTDGEIVAANADDCGLPAGGSRGLGVRAGSCVEVQWHVKTIRNCPAAGPGDNVVRHLKDSIGVTKPIGSIRRDAPESESSPSNTIKQFLVLPSPLPIGQASYISSACFACNPLQHLFWPICIEGNIDFEIVK